MMLNLKSHNLPNPALATDSETNVCMASPTQITRQSPIKRRRKSISPRNLPKITDQELQQLSGEYPLLF